MRGLALLALLLLSSGAGCFDAATPVADGEAAAQEDDARMGRVRGEGSGHYDNQFELQVNANGGGTACVIGTCLDNRDCVAFSEEGIRDYFLKNGTATLMWTASQPAAERLGLRVAGSETVDVSGPSPLTVTFSLLAPAVDGGVAFSVEHEPTSVPFLQDVSLRLVFDHTDTLPAANLAVC
ncbi:MAG TPA: hypothetical protein VJ874_00445 [Candidatus Thermoplasmatota archaeon]|nr:hypothetical protein [Candidatus Thermoplasmatota archaeon]